MTDLLVGGAHGDAAVDMAITHAVLQQVAAGRRLATLRFYRPVPTLAFGRLDVLRPGFASAAQAARRHGFTPVLRLAGGRAAVYDESSVIVDDVAVERDPTRGLQARFDDRASLLAGVLRRLGADARIGQLPDEYCPGPHSINVAGRLKVVGVAQRTVRGAALVSSVVVVGGGPRVRAVLADVYRALGLPFDRGTAGSADEAASGLTAEAVAQGVRDAYADRGPLSVRTLDDELLSRATELAARHRVP